MITISDAIKEIITQNPILQFGFQNQILNMAQTAKFIKPLVIARTKKEVSDNALHMAICRAQRQWGLGGNKIKRTFSLFNITAYSNLAVLTFSKSPKLLKSLGDLYKKIEEHDAYFTMTQGVGEVTIIIEQRILSIVLDTLVEEPLYKYQDISGLGVKFSKEYLSYPGLLYFVIQQITMQGINIIELSSSATELILYLESKDVSLAFNTLQTQFQFNSH